MRESVPTSMAMTEGQGDVEGNTRGQGRGLVLDHRGTGDITAVKEGHQVPGHIQGQGQSLDVDTGMRGRSPPRRRRSRTKDRDSQQREMVKYFKMIMVNVIKIMHLRCRIS